MTLAANVCETGNHSWPEAGRKEGAMRVSECVECEVFPCADVKHNGYVVPGINLSRRRSPSSWCRNLRPKILTTTITQRVIRCC